MYARHASEIARLSTSREIAIEIDELITKLKSKFPSRDEFIAEFRNLAASEKLTREKPLVRYVLQRISQYEAGTVHDGARMTIEHLASQGGRGHSLKDEVVAEIGNLAWVSEEVQKKLGTKKIGSKVEILRSAHCWVDATLDRHKGEWDKKAIRARTDHLAELAYDEVWRIV